MKRHRLDADARSDLVSIHKHVARDNRTAANLRSFSVGHYVVLYRPVQNGIEVARVIHSARDIGRSSEFSCLVWRARGGGTTFPVICSATCLMPSDSRGWLSSTSHRPSTCSLARRPDPKLAPYGSSFRRSA